MKTPFLDKIINKYFSRKLIVFMVASVALFGNYLLSGDWVVIATVYIGSQAVVDIVEKIYKTKKINDE